MTLLKLLAIYLPFEEFILKWTPVSDTVYLFLRQVPDLLVAGLAGALMLGHIGKTGRLPIIGGKADLCLMLFVFWAFLTLIFNPAADVFVVLVNIKALLRYVLLIYVVLLLNPTQREISSVLRWIMIAVWCQAVVGVIQWLGGIPVRDFLAARHVTETIGGMTRDFTGDRFEGVNDLMGTMGDNISYAFFMLIGLAIWLFGKERGTATLWGGSAFFVALIYLSGSRSATIVSLLLLAGYYYYTHGVRRSVLVAIGASVLAVPFLLIALTGPLAPEAPLDRRSFWFMFTGDYIEAALNQRLGIMVYLVPKLIFNLHILYGFSADKYMFADFAASALPMVPDILIEVLPKVIEDVYWVALFVYYGAVGFLLLAGFLCCLMMRIRRSLYRAISREYFVIGVLAVTAILLSVPLNFLNQAFEVRGFAFYLWLFCGLALVGLRRSNAGRRARVQA